MKKLSKKMFIVATAAAGALTVTGMGLLTGGCQYKKTVSLEVPLSPQMSFKVEFTGGYGVSNYGHVYSGKMFNPVSKEWEKVSNEKLSEINSMNEKRSHKKYLDWLDGSKKQYEHNKAKYEELKKTGASKEVLEIAKMEMDLSYAPQVGYALMVSGSVIFSIFLAMVIALLVVYLVQNKNRTPQTVEVANE